MVLCGFNIDNSHNYDYNIHKSNNYEVKVMDEMVKKQNDSCENKTALTVEEQQQAYVEAVKQMKKEEKQAKKKKRLIKLGVFAVIIVMIFVGTIISSFIHSADDISSVAISQTYLPVEENEQIKTYKTNIENAITGYIGDKNPDDEEIHSTLIEQAQIAMDKGSYYGAYIILQHCADNENAKELINECNYQIAVTCIDKNHNGTAWAHIKHLDNYKNSDALEIWLHYQNLSTVQFELLKSTVQSNCKDPTSFREEYGSQFYIDINEDKDAKSGHSLYLKIDLVYSATNSYGGRLRDTYTYEFDPFDFDIHGKSTNEAARIVKLNKTQILNECE